ncbi:MULTISPECIES: restriction endonuclease subunit S [Sphingobacterium]|uniref:restriction endonuclease subunit S n=1 Tax=Sphingobacterium TaxID=28453 RepID=UPI002580F918|nr:MULTISPECIES: restriction endonuclease subunit S [Sphingobacterium]
MPESWEWCRLGSIAKNVLYGVSKSAQTEGDYRLLRITDIQNNSVDWENVPFTTLPKEKVSEYLLEQHDILFARTGATVGKSYLVNEVNNNVIYASYLIRVRLFEMFNSQYIKFYFESGFYWGQVTDKSVGVGQPNVNGTSLKSLLIPIPPYEEQLLIGKQALELTDIIHNINNSQKDLSDYIQDTKSKILDLAIQGKLVPQNPSDEPASVLLERIKSEYPNSKKKVSKTSDNSHYENLPFEIPESWEWCRLIDICSIITDGTHQTPTYSDEGYIFLSSKNVTSGKIDWENVMYIPEFLHNQLYARLAPQKGDILLAKNGTTGFSAVVDSDCVFDIYVSLALLRPFENEISPYYLRYIMSSSFVQGQFRANLKGIGVPNLHLENIRSTCVPVCSLKEQNKIVSVIDQLFKILDNMLSEL